MKYKVIGGKWGEGYVPGQIINIDLDAAKVRLELGELVEVKDEKIKEEVMPEEVVESAAATEIVSHETSSEVQKEEKSKRGRPKKV